MTSTDTDISIVVFDDDKTRQTKADLLRDQTGYEVQFVSLENKDAIEEVEKAIGDLPPPSLVLMDHVLSKALAQSTVRKGTSIVPLLRERWPDAPVIAVTGAYEPKPWVYDEWMKDIDKEVYEDAFPIECFSSLVSYAPSVIAGYKAIGDVLGNLDGLLSLLNSPESEMTALASSMPSAIKGSLGKTSFRHRVFRWFRRTFYRKPGFLLDRRWAALAIGVSDEQFSDYSEGITDARYDGIFADSNDPRWWKARLYSCLLPDSRERFTVGLCEAAKEKLQIRQGHESRCYRCGEKWPEVMGYVDESAILEKEEKPLHLRCSRMHALSAPEAFYEERRVMLDDE